MTSKSTPRYVNNFSEYAALRGIDITELPEGLRATSNDGQVYEIIEGSWRHVGVSDSWVPDDDWSNCYRVDHDPLDPQVQAGSETLHTIDCHGVDPAIIQDYLDSYIAHQKAVAEVEALAEKTWVAQDRQSDLFGRHGANREALRGALNAVARAAA